MKNVIYKIRNVVNEHYYVGSTVDSRKRFWEHRKDLRLGRHVCIRLQRAWNKYGEDCFKFEIVEQLSSREELYPAEQKWLDEHYGAEYCYNVAAHADAPMRDASPEMRARLAAKTKAWLERDGHPRQGYKCTPEEIAYSAERRKGKAAGPEHYRYGKEVSPEVRAKIGATQKGVPKAPGRKVSAEGRAKIKANIEAGRSHKHWQGRTHTAEARAKMSKRVLAISPEGVETVYTSLTETLQTLGFLMPTLTRALKSATPITRGKFTGWAFKYVDPT
jgi:group I intron endonuclease